MKRVLDSVVLKDCCRTDKGEGGDPDRYVGLFAESMIVLDLLKIAVSLAGERGTSTSGTSLLQIPTSDGLMEIKFSTTIFDLPLLRSPFDFGAGALLPLEMFPFEVRIRHLDEEVFRILWKLEGSARLIAYRPGKWEVFIASAASHSEFVLLKEDFGICWPN